MKQGNGVLFSLVTAVLMQHFSAPAMAQQDDIRDSFRPSSTETNFFRQEEIGSRLSETYSPLNSNNTIDGFGSNYRSDTSSFGLSEHPQIWCESNDEDCIPDSKVTDFKTFEPAPNQYHFNAFGPMAGLTYTMTAPAHGKQMTELLTSRLGVMSTTWALTEPGVQDGMLDALKMSLQFVTNRYLADDQIHRSIASNPEELREIGLQVYNSCIAKYMKSDDGGDSDSDNPAGEGGWIEAQSRCMGGEKSSLRLPNSFTDVDPNSTLKLTDDPNHPDSTLSAGVENSAVHDSEVNTDRAPEKHLYLTDYMFNVAAVIPGSGITEAFGVTIDNTEAIKHVRRSWRELYGDVLICASAGLEEGENPCKADDAANPMGGIVVSKGVNTIWVKKEPPQIYEGPLSLDQAGAPFFYKGLTEQTWRRTFGLLLNRCNNLIGIKNVYDNDGVAIGSTDVDLDGVNGPYSWLPGVNPQGTNTGGDNDFWTAPRMRKYLAYVSIRGFEPTPAFIDGLLQFWLDRQGMKSFQELGDCTSLDPDNSDETKFSEVINQITTRGSRDRRYSFQRAVFLFAHHIASGQLFGTFIQSKEMVNGLTGGMFSGMVRKLALSLIYDAAGGEDLNAMYASNLEALRNFETNLFERRAIQIGQGGAAVIAQFGQTGEKQGGSPEGGL